LQDFDVKLITEIFLADYWMDWKDNFKNLHYHNVVMESAGIEIGEILHRG
jgi:hypothetical protein